MGTHRIENWPRAGATMAPELQKEFAAHVGDGRVGNKLLSETDRVRVWAIGLEPGSVSASTPTCSTTFGRRSPAAMGAHTSATERCLTPSTSQATSAAGV